MEAVIKQLNASAMADSAEIVRESFGTVAKEFNLTRENAPTNGAFTQAEHLEADLANDCAMYGLFVDGVQVGFMELKQTGPSRFELKKIGVRPQYRHAGYGAQLLDHAKAAVRRCGGEEIAIGIIEENTVLKNWYAAHGFKHTGTKKFPHLPFTVGFMAYRI